jgi:hypothetical protein
VYLDAPMSRKSDMHKTTEFAVEKRPRFSGDVGSLFPEDLGSSTKSRSFIKSGTFILLRLVLW